MWQMIKAACLRSLTVAWSYVLVIGGSLLTYLDTLSSIVTDKQVSDSVGGLLGTDPKVLGKWLMAVGVITTVARVRGLMAKPQP